MDPRGADAALPGAAHARAPGGAQIWPSSVADDLVDASRLRLNQLNEDPIAKDIRLR